MIVYFLDYDFNTIGIVDEFESLIWTDRYFERGDFELYVPASNTIISVASSASYLYLPESEHSMIIERIQLQTNIEDGDKVVISGRSLEWILSRRVIKGQKTYNGNLQEAIHSMINECFIEPEDDSRKVSNFVFVESTDEAITGIALESDIQTFCDTLYDVIAELCIAYEIGFKLILNNGNLEFSLYSGVDRSFNQEANPYVIFSPDFDNLISSGYSNITESYKNVCIVSGEGDSSNKIVTEYGDATGLDRYELYVDASSVSKTYTDENGRSKTYTNEEYEEVLQYAGELQLADYQAEEELEIEIEPNSSFQLGKDYFIGDIIQTKNSYGIEIAARVTEVIYNQDSDGIKIYPTVEIVRQKDEEDTDEEGE